jgi:hypothetical protein
MSETSLAVIFVEPRPHYRFRSTVENILVAAVKWRVENLRLYMTVGKGLKSWAGDIVQASEKHVRSVHTSFFPHIHLDLVELPSRSLTGMEYSAILVDPAYTYRIFKDTEEGASHVLVTQTDAWLSTRASAPSVWEFAKRYDYVGCPGLPTMWVGVCKKTAPDGVCSLNGGLSLRSIEVSMMAVQELEDEAHQAHEDVFFMDAFTRLSAKIPEDDFGKRFCDHAFINPPEPPPLGFHKINAYHPEEALIERSRIDVGLKRAQSPRVVVDKGSGPVLEQVATQLVKELAKVGIEGKLLSCPQGCADEPFSMGVITLSEGVIRLNGQEILDWRSWGVSTDQGALRGQGTALLAAVPEAEAERLASILPKPLSSSFPQPEQLGAVSGEMAVEDAAVIVVDGSPPPSIWVASPRKRCVIVLPVGTHAQSLKDACEPLRPVDVEMALADFFNQPSPVEELRIK